MWSVQCCFGHKIIKREEPKSQTVLQRRSELTVLQMWGYIKLQFVGDLFINKCIVLYTEYWSSWGVFPGFIAFICWPIMSDVDCYCNSCIVLLCLLLLLTTTSIEPAHVYIVNSSYKVQATWGWWVCTNKFDISWLFVFCTAETLHVSYNSCLDIHEPHIQIQYIVALVVEL